MKYIVTLGASAGGLSALESFCKELPETTGCAFVIVQHLSPDFKSLMRQLLAAYTQIPIKQVTSGMPIQKDHIYLIPAGRLMTVENGVFSLRPRDQVKMPINVFLESAAKHYGNRCIGIVFSGTGSDGTSGCKIVREKGGLVLAQDPKTAEFGSMPQSVVSQGLAHAVVDSNRLWDLIKIYDGNPNAIEEKVRAEILKRSQEDPEAVEEYSEIFTYLKRLFEIDFSLYKVSSVSRRIQRRMDQANVSSVSDYKDLLIESTTEADALYRDLLIGVTAFFRDTAIFLDFAQNVIEKFFEQPNPPDEFRCWVAGCASGEEAYTVAILADEIAHKHNYHGRINIFATDMHKGSVQKAGQGVFGKDEVANLSDERLAQYFKVTDEGQFRIKPEMRQKVVFAQHNLIVDPPFTRIDVVTCRNLLIYLKPEVQSTVLRSFSYALKPQGILFLGASESLGELERSFETISSKSKIFKKIREVSIPEQRHQVISRPLRSNISKSLGMERNSKTSIDRRLLESYDSILRKYAPDGILINHDREVQHYLGDAGNYCIPSEGRAERDVLSMLSGDLKLAVSTGLQRILKNYKPVSTENIQCTTRHGDTVIDVSIEPFNLEDESDFGLILITFLKRDSPADHENEDSQPIPFKIDSESENRILMLEDELRSTKENLQATVEELQTSNEELQAINEEVQVSNEELQSTNEELHSMNEELYSVNSELEQKNHQLIELNSDHENLLINTEDAVLYVDSALRIKKFNPAIGFAFNLLPQDIGRPLSHIAYILENHEEMLRDVQDVLDSGIRKEREARSLDGVIYLRRFTPFRDGENNTTGVVLTFTDVTEISKMRSRLSRAMDAAGMAWWEWDIPQDELNVHAEGDCILGYDCDEITNNSEFWFDRVHPDDLKMVKESLNECLKGSSDNWVCEHRYARASDGNWEWVYEVGKVTRRGEDGQALEMSGTTMNIHTRKSIELELKQAKEDAEAAIVKD